MGYRFVHLTTDYDEYVGQFYAQRPGLALQPYGDQREELMHDAFGWADFWSAAMGELGYETEEILANVEPLQSQWAWENGIQYGANWYEEVALAQFRLFQPEVVFVSHVSGFSSGFLNRLRDENPSLQLLLAWIGAPYSDVNRFRHYDAVLSNIPEFVDDLRSRGHVTYLMRHAFDPRILDRLTLTKSSSHDFTFAGTVGSHRSPHGSRTDLLKALIGSTPLEVFARTEPPRRLAQLLQRFSDGFLSYGESPKLFAACRPPCYGLEMFQLLHESRISLNSHIDVSRASASNMRLYEATGVGSCLLSDAKSNLHEMFEVDREIVVYSSIEECIEKARWLLDHEAERCAIAAAGQRRTLADHTFASRAVQMDCIIGELMHNKAPQLV